MIFANINVRSNDQKAVVAAFRRLPRRQAGYVAPAMDGWVTVFDEISDSPDEDRLSGYTVMLSDRLQTHALGFLVYESDVLLYTLAEKERLLDHYSSWPDYFDEDVAEAEWDRLKGDDRALARLAAPPASPQQVRAVLDGEHDFAEEKLQDLVRVLGLPEHAGRWGYHFLADSEEVPERPEAWADFVHVPAAFQTLT
jgi:hypothetical protein